MDGKTLYLVDLEGTLGDPDRDVVNSNMAEIAGALLSATGGGLLAVLTDRPAPSLPGVIAWLARHGLEGLGERVVARQDTFAGAVGVGGHKDRFLRSALRRHRDIARVVAYDDDPAQLDLLGKAVEELAPQVEFEARLVQDGLVFRVSERTAAGARPRLTTYQLELLKSLSQQPNGVAPIGFIPKVTRLLLRDMGLITEHRTTKVEHGAVGEIRRTPGGFVAITQEGRNALNA